MKLRNTAAIATITFALTVSSAHAQQYQFTKMADSRNLIEEGLEPFLGGVGVNNAGQVSFISSWEEGRDKVFRTGAGGLTLIVDDASASTRLGEIYGTFMNDAGQVAFAADVYAPESTESGIFRGAGGNTLTTIASTTGPFDSFAGIPSINNTGDVSFMSYLDTFPGGLFVGNGSSPVRTLVNTDDGVFDNAYGQTSINDAGHIAFEADRKGRSQGIHLYRDGAIVTLVEEGPLFSAVSNPVINQRSGVLFQALDADGMEEALYLTYGGALTKVADTTGRLDTIHYHDLNDRDQIAYQAAFMAGENFNEGLFTGPDFERDHLISIGDRLDGSTIVDVGLGGINNAGQIAFWADLEDGRSVVFLATPTVPEPAMLSGVAAFIAMGLLHRRRRRP